MGETKLKLIKTEGIMNDAVHFVIDNQLRSRETWKLYIDVFNSREDSNDERWRGEYFGKQMRGACLAYQYTQDEELYDTLTWACEELLKTQDELGRIATYNVDNEFHGWDMWCRKYVLTGLQHFYHICKDEELKKNIMEACCKHLDYIISKIGPGKIDITTTSKWWGCVNSCTILEPVMEMVKLTGFDRYMDFAKYIISTGGSSDCNFIELALDGQKMPYEYPVTKAYEIMSFFEGLLAYYEVTGEKMYFEAADKFFEAVNDSDITIIGCSGCTHELFDNSVMKQTEYSEEIMQETCVTVTWMRIMYRLYKLTCDTKYIDRIEQSGFNALYGSLNTDGSKQLELVSKKYCDAKTFDSYSPLYMNSRGRGIGGYLEFDNGEYGGCCVAIGACGVSLVPLSAIECNDNHIYINYQFRGTAVIKDAKGRDIILNFESDYPTTDRCVVKVQADDEVGMIFHIRKPCWCDKMSVNGTEVREDGYYQLPTEVKNGDQIVFEWPMNFMVNELNDKVAFTYGPLVMACDSAKDERDIEKPIFLEDGFEYELLKPENDELQRMILKTKKDEILLTDYQSCGKHWLQEKNIMTVWLNK